MAISLIKVRSLGTLSEFLDAAGENVDRVLSRADLPCEVLDHPEMFIPLRDQSRILDSAAREMGDVALGARLARASGVAALGCYGRSVMSAPVLSDAVSLANRALGVLQSGTGMSLEVTETTACWRYDVKDQAASHFHHNVLALGYMIELLRCFVDPTAQQVRLTVRGDTAIAARSLEDLFDTDVRICERTSISFPRRLLAATNKWQTIGRCSSCSVIATDFGYNVRSAVDELIKLAQLSGLPKLAWISDKLQMSPRTIQRALKKEGTTFDRCLEQFSSIEARKLVGTPGLPLTEIAFQLGYSDLAHFSRAFKRWTGQSPTNYRKSAKRSQGIPLEVHGLSSAAAFAASDV